MDRFKNRGLNLQIKNITLDKNTFAKLVFGYFLILLLYRYHSSAFLIYTYGQPMKGVESDYSHWISLAAGFPHFIIQHYYACVLVDSAVILFSIGAFLSDKYRNLLCILLMSFFFVQRMTIEIYSCSHVKSMSAVFIMLLPFCFKREKNFKLAMEFARYFLVYILVASAFYKFHNGALLHPANFSAVLVNQHSDLAILNPGHISFRIASVLIAHPSWAAASYILLFITQFLFITGIFTKQWDRILFVLLIIFAVFTYLVMRIYNFDILILGLSLLYFPVPKK